MRVMRAIALAGAIAASVPSVAQADEPGGAVEIVSLFRADCVPCRHELAILPRIAERHPDITVTLLVLHDDGTLAQAADTLKQANLRIRPAEADAEEIMAAYGDDQQALPFSAAIDATGKVCARHYGLLGLDLAEQWSRAC